MQLSKLFVRAGFVRSFTIILGCCGAAALLTWTFAFAQTTLAQRSTLSYEMTRPYDCWVSSARAGIAVKKGLGMQELASGSPFALIPSEVLAAVRAHPLVKESVAVAVFRMQLRTEAADRELAKAPPLSVGGINVLQYQPADPQQLLTEGRWPSSDEDAAEVVLMATAFTDRDFPAPALGSTVQLSTSRGVAQVTIVGYLQPRRLVSGFPTAYISPDAFELLMPGYTAEDCNLLLCTTGSDTSAQTLREAIITAAGDKTGVTVLDRHGLTNELRTDLLRNISRQIPLMITLALLTAACLTGTAVRIGLSARLRIFALYRVLGATGRQIVRMAAAETAIFSLIAWLAGSLIGLVLVAIFVRIQGPETYPDGMPLRVWLLTPLYTALPLAVVNTIAVCKPIRRLCTLEPLSTLAMHAEEAATLRTQKSQTFLSLQLPPALYTLLALIFIPAPLLLLLPFHCSAMTRSLLILFVGLPFHIYGLLKITPLVIRLADALASRVISPLLTQAAGRSPQRTLALIITVTAGLGSYCAIQIWGASMMQPFVPSRTLPDVIAAFEPNGLTAEQAQDFAAIPGVQDFRTFSAKQYVLDEPILQHLAQTAGTPPSQNNLLVMGLEQIPSTLRGLDGQPLTLQGDGCVIPMMFARQGGFKLGDTLTVCKLSHTGELLKRSWTITGITDVNWHLFTARAGLRAREGAPLGTLAPLFVLRSTLADFEADDATRPGPFVQPLGRSQFAWFNLKPGADYAAVDATFKQRYAALQEQAKPTGRGAGRPSAETRVTLQLRDEIADGTIAHGAELIGALARIPFWSLALLLVGVISIIQANIRTRENEFALLRTIGMTTRQLRAQLLSEAALQLLLGILMSLLFGIIIGWTFTAWTRAWMPFGGLPIVLRIPWALIGQGIGFTLLLGLLYGLLPIYLYTRRFAQGSK